MTANVSDAIQTLRSQFAEQLADRIEAIQKQHARLTEGGWTMDEAETLHRLVHGLTGAAGTFGMRSLSAAAREMEEHLAQLLKSPPSDSVPDDTAWAELAANLERLSQLADIQLTQNAAHLKPIPTTPAADPDHVPLVYLVEDDAEQATHVSQVLLEAGYRVQTWQSADAFRTAMAAPETERPSAVIMDMIFPEGEDTGARLISECGLGRAGEIPVVTISVRDDLDARLRALRAGSARYLVKPVQDKTLIDLLEALTGRQPTEPYRVLLIDDDPLLLETHAGILREAGMDVQTLSEPLMTLERVKSFHPDLLLIDVYMPEVSGPELAAALRESEEHLHLPILFLSAETDMSEQLLALNLGGDDFLVKPIRPEYLVSTVTARARRARQSNTMWQRLQTTLYEREREHLALNRHAIVSIADRRGSITYVNDQFCQVSGYSRDELLGQNHRLVKSGQHPPEFYHEMWKTIRSGQVWQGEICNRRKDGSLYWVESSITPFVDDEGVPYQYVSIRTDITAIKAALAEQQSIGELKVMLAESAAELLAAGPATLDAAIDQALRRAGEHLGADRAYLFQLFPDDAHLSNTHEWCAPGIAPQKNDLQSVPTREVMWWWAQMQRGEWISIPDLSAMPTEAAEMRATFEQLGIRALCAYPIQRAGKTVGFIGFDQANKVRDWDARTLNLLGLLSGVMQSALVRSEGERALAETSSKLAATLESTKDGILAVDTEGEVLFMNQQFRQMWKNSEIMLDSASDEAVLAHMLAQLVDPEGFMASVETVRHSGEESDDLVELNDGRIFMRHFQPLKGYGSRTGRVWSFHDITEHRRAEMAAEAAKERLRRGQLYANIGTWEWNMITGELFWTERIAPLFGYPLGDLETSYDNFLAAVHPEDRQAVIDAVEACIERDVPYEIEHRVVWPDGTVRWLLERGAVQRDAEGKPLQMIGVVQDIDDRKRAELALLEREQQLLEAQSLASLGNWRADLLTGELVWSDEIYRIFGYEPGAITPSVDAFYAAVHPDDRQLVRDDLLEAEKTGRHNVIHRIIRPDGRIRHVHEFAQAEVDAEGKLIGLTGTVQDVTDQVKAEQRIRESEQRFAFAVEGAGDGVWDWQLKTGEMSFSAHYEPMLGYRPGELVERVESWKDSVHPDDLAQVQQKLTAYLEGRSDQYNVELRLRCKDGNYKWVLCRSTVVERDAQGEPVRMIGIHSNISERKDAEEALIAAREEADRANRAKSEFLSNMSHELRTPMNAILGFGQLLEYDDSLGEETQENVSEILKAGQHLLELINEVLDLAKVESGRIDLSLEPVTIRPIVDECIGLVTPLAEQRGIALSRESLSGAAVRADRTRLKQALLNLLSNAIKYNREGGKVRLTVRPEDSDRLCIQVSDTGRGIPADKLAELFQPFSRLDAEGSDIEGTGIGLTITRRIVEMMGGSVDVESEIGVGSTFYIELPLETPASPDTPDVATTPGAVPAQAASAQPATVSNQTVLYIEDNPANLKLVAQIFGHVPHIHLLIAHTPSLGIELALAHRPELILLDINLPGLDGYQVLEVFKAEASLKNIPVIAITANALPQDRERARAAGFADYLTKPLAVDRLLESVNTCLAHETDPPCGQGGKP